MTSFVSQLVLVRHGETDWNIARRIQGRTNVPLNARGLAQAAEVAGFLGELFGGGEAKSSCARVLSSPLDRTRRTAETIAARLPGSSVDTSELLLERDFGPAEGLGVAVAAKRWPGLVVPGAETPAELARRGAGFVSGLLSGTEPAGSAAPADGVAPAAGPLVLVSHGAFIRATLSRITGSEIPRVLNGEAWLLQHNPVAAASFTAKKLFTPSNQHPV